MPLSRTSSARPWARAMATVERPHPPPPVTATSRPRQPATTVSDASSTVRSAAPTIDACAASVATSASRVNVGDRTAAAPSAAQSRVTRSSVTTITAHSSTLAHVPALET